MDEKDFFYYLLKKTETAFLKSDIYNYQIKNNKNWNYAVCDTQIKKNKGIILGLNWGGDNKNPQSVYPQKNKKRNWRFFNNITSFFKSHLNITSIEEINYYNLCFYRTPKIEYLKSSDWEQSISLTNEYIRYISPPWIVLLGKTGFSKLKTLKFISEIERFEIQDKKNRVFGYKAKLHTKFDLYCVPHPQARVSKQARIKIWDSLFK
jgi:hypothetical protein